MPLLTVLAVLQGTSWVAAPAGATVGDTIVLERVVPAVPGARARTAHLETSELLEPLGPPEIVPVAVGLRVRHTVALFAPGEHRVPMPAIELLHPDGSVEVVLGDTAAVRVPSVIPESLPNAAPMPSQAPLARSVRREGRAVAPVVVVAGFLAAWLLWRRRLGTAAAVAPPDDPVPELPLMRWLALGERRAVATVAVHRLRSAVAAAVPEADRATTAAEWTDIVGSARADGPGTELAEILRALERARFAPLGADDLAELVDRADVAVARLRGTEEGAA